MNHGKAELEKILVVEDNVDILLLLQRMLKGKGYQVITADNENDAMRMIKEEDPHLVLLDLNLPKDGCGYGDGNGYNICRMIKETEETKYIPVIIITCRSSLQEKIMGLEFGADDYIVKPFAKEEVLARVKSLLKLRSLHSQLIQAEKLATLVQVAVRVNHEVNNPLCAISANAEIIKIMLNKGVELERIQAKADIILHEVDRIKQVIEKLSKATRVVSMEYISGIPMLDIDQSIEQIEGSSEVR
ncbi:MAG: response regulator [bacterium]